MRILIGIASLLLIFAVSTLWHRFKIDELRAETGLRKLTVEAAERDLAPGWGEVIVGAPSGADPIHVERRRAHVAAHRLRPPGKRSNQLRTIEAPPESEQSSDAIDHGLSETSEPLVQPADWELEVRPGDVLSSIVRQHYGRVSPDLEQKLAEYNGLKSPDKLKVGQILFLPTEEHLLQMP